MSPSRIKAPGCQEYITNTGMHDKLIFEDNQVKIYEQSRQYEEDINKYKLQKDLKEEKRKNEELTKIANMKVKKELELEAKNQEPNEYQRKIYLLRNMRWSQQS